MCPLSNRVVHCSLPPQPAYQAPEYVLLSRRDSGVIMSLSAAIEWLAKGRAGVARAGR